MAARKKTEEKACKACGGTGKNSKGKPCDVCMTAKPWERGDVLATTKKGCVTPLIVVGIGKDGRLSLADQKNTMLAAPVRIAFLQENGYAHLEHVEDMDEIEFQPCGYEIDSEEKVFAGEHTVTYTKRKKREKKEDDEEGEEKKDDEPLDGWSVAVTGKRVFEVEAEFTTSNEATDTAFVALVPDGTPHTVASVNDAYVWYSYLLCRGERGDAPMRCVKGTCRIPVLAKPGEYRLCLCTEDSKHGRVAASSEPFEVKA